KVLGVAGVGVAGGQFQAQAAGNRDVSLEVDALDVGVAGVGDELDLAHRRHDQLLDVVPFDVVDAGREADAVVEVVLGADLVALHRVRAEGRRIGVDAEIGEVGRTGGIRNRVVGAAG